MGESLERFFADESDQMGFAAEMGRHWREERDSLCVGLIGDLGAGKTTWVRGLLRGLGHRGRVPSPTFSLVEPYQFGELQVVHLDLYRLSNEADAVRDLEDLGVREWVGQPNTWLLVEWPERWPGFDQIADVRVELALQGEGRAMRLIDLC